MPRVDAAAAKKCQDLLRSRLTGGLSKEPTMSSTELPRHIIDRVERRWAKKLEQQARAWKTTRSEPRSLTDQGIPVIRRVQRSRPPQKAT